VFETVARVPSCGLCDHCTATRRAVDDAMGGGWYRLSTEMCRVCKSGHFVYVLHFVDDCVTVWFIHSSDCFSEDNQYWTLVFWLSLCYVWIAVYLCLLTLQYMLRSDPQFNHIGVFGGRRQMLPALLLLRLQDMPINPNQGLPPNQISAIAFCDPPSPASGVDTCSICIDHFKKDELCKKLPGCPHYFHAQCIDSWLTRKSDCPVCRTPVIVNPDVVISPRMADIV